MFKILRQKVSPPVVEQRTFQLPDKHISYTLKRSGKRRSIGLRIDDRGLTVSMPLRASEKWLHSVLLEKADWVMQKLDSWQSKKVPTIEWADYARIPFRGEEFILRVIPDMFGAPPRLHKDELRLQLALDASPEIIEKLVTQWYRQEALRVFEECVAHFAPLMGVTPSAIKLSSARSQWAVARCTVWCA